MLYFLVSNFHRHDCDDAAAYAWIDKCHVSYCFYCKPLTVYYVETSVILNSMGVWIRVYLKNILPKDIFSCMHLNQFSAYLPVLTHCKIRGCHLLSEWKESCWHGQYISLFQLCSETDTHPHQNNVYRDISAQPLPGTSVLPWPEMNEQQVWCCLSF